MGERHMAETSMQMHHIEAARGDRNFYARNNGGHPQVVAAERPMGFRGNERNDRPQTFNTNRGPQPRPDFQKGRESMRQPQMQPQRGFDQRPSPQQRGFEQRQAPQQRQLERPAPQQRGFDQQPRGNAQPRFESRPAPQEHGGGGGRPQHEDKGHR